MLLKEFLQKQGVKKRVFAKNIGLSPTGLWRILKGFNKPSLLTALRIEKFTDGQVTCNELLKMENCDLKNTLPLEERIVILEKRVAFLETK